MAKYNYIELSQRQKMNEKELNALKNFINTKTSEAKEVLKLFRKNPKIYDAEGIVLDQDQTQKAKKYLYNLGFTPKGAERKNSPLGAREEYIAKNVKSAYLLDFYDAGNFLNTFYVPLYQVEGKDGTTMDYYVSGGKINVIG